MLNTFYLMTTKEHSSPWYMLMVRDTHFCLSCGDELERILTLIKDYVKTYRTRERLFRALSELDGQGIVSPATFDQREDYFRAHGEDYVDLVHSVVLEALAEARQEDKANSPLNKARTRLQKAGGVKTIVKSQEVSPKVDSTPTKDSPAILRKPRVFNRK